MLQKSSVLFGNNTLEVSLLFDINSGKCLAFIGRTFPKVSSFFGMNSEKKCVLLFDINSAKVSELFDISNL